MSDEQHDDEQAQLAAAAEVLAAIYAAPPSSSRYRGYGCQVPPTEAIGYTAAHARVYRARGKASAHRCIDCGRAARDWSYDGSDPDEMLERISARVEDTRVRRFSADVNRYVPRCRRCHARRDLGGRQKPYCLRGHEVAAVGRDACGRCRQCQRDADHARRVRRLEAAAGVGGRADDTNS